MGNNPLPRIPPPRVRETRLGHLGNLYILGSIDVETFERVAGLMLAQGVADDPYDPQLVAPPKREDAARSARPPSGRFG